MDSLRLPSTSPCTSTSSTTHSSTSTCSDPSKASCLAELPTRLVSRESVLQRRANAPASRLIAASMSVSDRA